MLIDMQEMRQSYAMATLDEAEVASDPFIQYQLWFKQAIDAGIDEPNAVTLATANRSGAPDCRVVLCKEVTSEGFVWYSNAYSQKGKELEENPQACLNFFWAELQRQVRIRGEVTQLPEAKVEAYFQTRPYMSRIGALASEQSTETTKDALEQKVAELVKIYPTDVPKPKNWTGYKLLADAIEFWQGRENRLHDRILYTKKPSADWKISRLAP